MGHGGPPPPQYFQKTKKYFSLKTFCVSFAVGVVTTPFLQPHGLLFYDSKKCLVPNKLTNFNVLHRSLFERR